MNLFEVSPRDYHTKLTCRRDDIFAKDSFLSKSVLWELNDSSLYKWRNYPKQFKPTEAMQWGSLVDTLATTPELEGSSIAVSPYDSYRTKEAQQWRDEQLSSGMTVITQDTLTEGRKAAKMLTETCQASAEIFARSKTQVIVAAKIQGVSVKGLVDLAPAGEDFLADLKTANDFTLEGFGKATAVRGYHVQAALYLRLWNAMFPDDERARFKIVWQDSSAPYEACVQEVAPHEIEAGWAYATRMIDSLVDATNRDCWPMAFESETILTRPVWASIQEDMKLNPPAA